MAIIPARKKFTNRRTSPTANLFPTLRSRPGIEGTHTEPPTESILTVSQGSHSHPYPKTPPGCSSGRPPRGERWPSVHQEAAAAIEQAHRDCRIPGKKRLHRRGHFHTLRCGVGLHKTCRICTPHRPSLTYPMTTNLLIQLLSQTGRLRFTNTTPTTWNAFTNTT